MLCRPQVASFIVLVISAACAGGDPRGETSQGREPSTADGSTPARDGSDAATASDAELATEPAPARGEVIADQPGPYAVGTLRIELEVSADRRLPVQLWYPAVETARAAAEAGRPLAEIEPEGARHDLLKTLVADAPDACTNKTLRAADAPASLRHEDGWPLILFSHCMDCTRFSAFSTSEHLSSWGFIVAAPDHEGGTLYDAEADASVGLTAAFLQTRGSDVLAVLDAMLDPSTRELPAHLRGQIDPQRIGAFGHSYGSVTTGLAMQNDARIRAGVFVAAPPENPLLGGVELRRITQPALFILAREDNSITAAGNLLLRNNYDNFPNEAWLLEVVDAGHWSFSDICGLTQAFQAGCGDGPRQGNPTATFTYLDNAVARSIARAYVLAYFARELLEDPVAAEYLRLEAPREYVTIMHHD
jgi:predicted dienelactone hydrolase